MKSLTLRGIIPGVVTPMNSEYEIMLDDLSTYIEWLSKFRLGGVAVNVDVSEGPHLTDEERVQVIRTVASFSKGKIPIIAGVPPTSTKQAVKTAILSRDAGADALLVFPHPSFLGGPLPPSLPYEYHKAIADATGTPIILFQLQPALGGYEFTAETLNKLTAIPEVIAIKEAMFDALKFSNMLRMVREAPRRITLLTGNDNFIAESLILGAEGALIGFGTVATDMQVDMYEYIQARKYDEAMEIQERLLPLVDAVFAPPIRDFRSRIKAILAFQGIIENAHVRPPLLDISKNELEKLKVAMIRTGLKIERQIIQI
jgi:4-hydroxy-tetrahydrodipicolinate synthase